MPLFGASMGYRVVGSSFTFESDLPPSSRDVHPSGMLHAFRSPRPDGNGGSDNINPDDDALADATDGGADGEHAFAWVENALHIKAALSHLEGRGFRRSESIVFLPYSTKRNWLRRYPRAAPALECREDGKCVVGPEAAAVRDDDGDGKEGEDDENAAAVRDAEKRAENSRKTIERRRNRLARMSPEEREELMRKERDYNKRYRAEKGFEERAREKYRHRAATNMFDDRNFIPDAERDELHIEIYNYLRWLHAKVSEVEERAQAAALEKSVASMIPPNNADIDGGGGGSAKRKRKEYSRPKGACVDLAELQGVIDKMESAFLIIPHAKEEAAAEIAAAEAAAAEGLGQERQDKEREQGDEEGASGKQRRGDEPQEGGPERGEEDATSGERRRSADADGEPRKTQAPPEASAANRFPNVESPPFLEQHCTEALFRKVLARERSGKMRRRSRRRKRPWEDNPNARSFKIAGFDEMFDKLLRYREEHGHVRVPKSRKKDDENNKLANWVSQIRFRRGALLRTTGLDHEPYVPGRSRGRTLTLERVQRLDPLGFVWSIGAPPRVPWEDRFREAVEYFEGHGRWPGHGMGGLGEWVHRQRTRYARGDASFMRDRAPKLDEVGFEWAPRGPRKRR